MQSFERSYLLCVGKEVNERLQFLYMRVALGIHGADIESVLETYDLLSTRKISLGSPILWNGGLANRSFASCYIYDPYAVEAVDAISNLSTLSNLWAADGGIGIHAGEVPATRCGVSSVFPYRALIIALPAANATGVTQVSCLSYGCTTR